jgi:hypothetical protein
MKHRGVVIVLAAAIGVVLVGSALAKEERIPAKEGYRRLVAVTTPDAAPAHPEAWPASLVEHRDWRGTPEQIDAWRGEGLARLSGAKLGRVEEAEDRAFVHVREAMGEAIVPLRWNADHWELAAPMEWIVKGAALDAANGDGPATVRLTARTTNDPYGSSAFSFAHVTQDPEQCLNRMDLWYCHNGDLHVVGDGGFLDRGRQRLSKAGDLPFGEEEEWSRIVPAREGHLYVLHAASHRDRDFFVALRLKNATKEAVELEWKLLSLGEGAPASIHEAQPWKPVDENMGLPGADGTAGRCGRNAH